MVTFDFQKALAPNDFKVLYQIVVRADDMPQNRVPVLCLDSTMTREQLADAFLDLAEKLLAP